MRKLLLITTLALLGALQTAAQTFPEKCLGVWTGTMEIYARGELKDKVDVRLTVARTAKADEFTWKTEYLSKTRPMTKDYVLRVVDASKGLYETDEGGGVKLSEYAFGDKMYNVFEVQGVFLTATYELRGKEMVFEVTSGRKGATVEGGVTNYSVDNLQRAVFKRIKK